MPAINLSRLKQQTGELSNDAQQPAVFIRRLLDILDFYADRTLRVGQGANSGVRLPAYNVPPQVLRQINLELSPWAASDPEAMLALADALWQEENLECRLIAVRLLAELPPEPPEPVLQRIRAWATTQEEPRILKEVLASGHTRLQKTYPHLWVDLVHDWLNDPNSAVQGIGLQALLSIVQDDSFTNLPLVYRNLSGFLQKTPTGLFPDLLEVIACLARRSPVETAYLLRQSLSLGPESSASRITRRSLDFFPAEIQSNLRQALVQANQTSSPYPPGKPRTPSK